MTTPDDTEARMLLAGWTRNFMGWWHPPACVACWPPGEAREMFRESEKRAKDGETMKGPNQ
jgi:hypothetical protein